MVLRGKAEIEFKEYYLKQDYNIGAISEYGEETVYKMFRASDIEFQFGVYVNFFDSKFIVMNVSEGEIGYIFYRIGYDFDTKPYEERNNARLAALEYAEDILNNGESEDIQDDFEDTPDFKFVPPPPPPPPRILKEGENPPSLEECKLEYDKILKEYNESLKYYNDNIEGQLTSLEYYKLHDSYEMDKIHMRDINESVYSIKNVMLFAQRYHDYEMKKYESRKK